MKTPRWIQPMFVLAAAYDGVLGIAFLVAGPAIYQAFEVTPPNHWGYVHFPAALLLVFAWMFVVIARAPIANRALIPYGIALKVAFCAVTFSHWATSGIPWMWQPFAITDLLFAGLFIWAYAALPASPRASTGA